jgi:hypothetical protein
VDFDSHINSMVLHCVDVVNALTPGESAGRPYPAPAVDEARTLVEKIAGADLAASHYTLSDAEVVEFAQAAGRLRPVFAAVAAGDIDTAAETLNTLMSDWHAQPMLSRHDGEPWHLHFHRPDAAYVEGWATGMATGLAYVVGSEYADRLGVCSAPACDRVYADTSRNGTRRFCSTACQNRVKAAAFRARRAGEQL